jgi:type II secretory pathway pseudopilin PulG
MALSDGGHGRLRGSRGSTLILFLGIMAALSILAIALVAVLANAQHSTSRDKARTTAFDITEAAVDVTMQTLASAWPKETDPWTATSFTTRAPNFESTFGVTYAAPQGDALWVSVLDDSASQAAGSVGWDQNDNGYLWIDAQARVNGVSSRIRTLLQAKFYEANVPRGWAVVANGSLLSNAPNGNVAAGKYKIGAQDVSIGGPQPVAIAIGGTIQNPEVAWPYVDQDPPTKPRAEEIITQDMIADLTQIADQTGKLFKDGALPSGDDFTGLCVVIAPAGVTVTLGQNGQAEAYNSPASPGILLVLGGATLKLAGNTEYYGVVYSEGDIGVANGHPIIYGMVVTKGSFDMAGVAQVIYREDCLINLNHQFQTSTRLVPNYWRELTPVDYSSPAAP